MSELQVCLECGQHVFETPQQMMRSIIRNIAAGYAVSYEEVMGTSRARHITVARQHAYHALFCCGYSYASIGRLIGRHHTSVMDGANAHEERMLCAKRRAEEQLRDVAQLGPCAEERDALDAYSPAD